MGIFSNGEMPNDTDYQYEIVSQENDTVWMGKGLGGGTFTFWSAAYR